MAASSTEKMFWRFTSWFGRECHILIVRSCQRVYVERLGLYFIIICQIAEARSMGLTANSLPEASLGDVGAGKFQLLFSSVFSCAVSVSLEISVIFLLSKYTDCPNCRYSLRGDCKRDLKNFRHVRWKYQSFSKLRLTRLHDNLFCWKA